MTPPETPEWKPAGRRFASVVACLALTGAAVSTPAGAQAAGTDRGRPSVAPYLTQSLDWQTCKDELGDPVAPDQQCTTVTVPQDWREPDAGTDLTVAISRTRATNPEARKGILFTNPGGPGGSGILLPQRLKDAQPALAAGYDLIGMDPRGVMGTSGTTGLLCLVDLNKMVAMSVFDSHDLSPAAVNSRQAAIRSIADGCAANPLTRYINTWQTAHDIDLVRALLGEAKLNYLGYSYGTWLGAKYAALFPGTVGKVVLDSNTGWTGDLSETWEMMPVAMQRKLEKQFAAYASRQPISRKYLGTTAARVYDSYLELRSAISRIDWGHEFDMADQLDHRLFRDSLYRDSESAGLAHVMAAFKFCAVDRRTPDRDTFMACVDTFDANNRDPALTPSLRVRVEQVLSGTPAATGRSADPFTRIRAAAAKVQASRANASDEELPWPIDGTYWAVRCGDGGNWHTAQWWIRKAAQLGPRYPFLGYFLYGTEVCPYWTQPAQPLPNPRADKVRTIVTVQAEFDPATAYEMAVRDARDFSGNRMISVDDAGTHGQYAIRGNSCVDGYVNRYLLDDERPPARVVCGGVPIAPETVSYAIPGPVNGKAQPARADARTEKARQRLADLIG